MTQHPPTHVLHASCPSSFTPVFSCFAFALSLSRCPASHCITALPFLSRYQVLLLDLFFWKYPCYPANIRVTLCITSALLHAHLRLLPHLRCT